jgi:hypothetical protein
MEPYELSNTEREYFGLLPIDKKWHRQSLNHEVTVYFDGDKIVKIILLGFGYSEYDTDIDTIQKTTLIPKSAKGKNQKLTVSKLLKIKGTGIEFSISLTRGGVTVYNNNRKLFIVKSYFEDGEIKSFSDARAWINAFIKNCEPDYLQWLLKQISQQKIIQNCKAGDIIAFKISQNEYGFARILKGIDKAWNPDPDFLIHPRSLIVATYAFISDTLSVDLDDLIEKNTLPTLYIFDNEVYYTEMPIVGFRTLNSKDVNIAEPNTDGTLFTMPYTKTDIQNFIKDSSYSKFSYL